jgi:hydrogenase maturation protease
VKPLLIIGLGSTLMGDDGVGARVAEALSREPAVIARADVLAGGTDLLRYMDQIQDRRRVVLIDAVESEGPPGEIEVLDELKPEGGLEYAHTLSAARALEVMRSVLPSLEKTRFTWVLIHVESVKAGERLSPAVEAGAERLAELIRGMK